MKLAACFLTLLPGFAVAASWTSPGFPAFSEQGTGTYLSATRSCPKVRVH